MFFWLKKLFLSGNESILEKVKQKVNMINSLEEEIKLLTNDQLREQTYEFKNKLSSGEQLDNLLCKILAVGREASWRTLGLRPFDEQLIGAIILHMGLIVEMLTGEGKTLVSALSAYLNSLIGKGVHVVTVNDYLAKRDSEWMGNIYKFLGLNVGCIVHGISDLERRNAYLADVTYATNNELGFDYLRDNMVFEQELKVQRPYYYAIIDEVDSILIDEARTPLVISGPVDDNSDLYFLIDKFIKRLSSCDYEKDEKFKTINLNEPGMDKLEKMLISDKIMEKSGNLYDFNNMHLLPYINQSLKANFIFNKDVDYIVKDNQIMIIDELTGRMMPGRRYSDGLHQALEAKENLPIQDENQTLASITFQNYFRMYPKLSGMTGTAMTEANEFKDIYNLSVVKILPHKPVKRIDYNDEIYGSNIDKYGAILDLLKECYSRGQPVLIGTASIEKSEEISVFLDKNGIKHNVLNAKNHEKEAYIIAQAGRYKAVTIATNMAGRGTDIMLGGNAAMQIKELKKDEVYLKRIEDIKQQFAKEKEEVINAGGLFIIGTERHESRRIDNQLRGRAGRQGDPGASKFFLSLEDDLMRIFASDSIANILRKLGLKGGEAINHPMINRAIAKAQKKVESHNYELRKNLLKFDDVMNEQRNIIYKQRNSIMVANEFKDIFLNMGDEIIESLILRFIPKDSFREDWDVGGLVKEFQNVASLSINEDDLIILTEDEIRDKLQEYTKNLYIHKKDIFGEDMLQKAIKYILLLTLDQLWKENLHSLDFLRQGISLRAYGQKDPLNEYKREAFLLFQKMMFNFSFVSLKRISYLNVDLDQLKEFSFKSKKLRNIKESRQDPAFNKYNAGTKLQVTPTFSQKKSKNIVPNDSSTWGKVGRNSLCPCNSGKKFKFCHGINK